MSEPMFFESYEDAAAYQRRVHDQRLMSMEAFSTSWRSLLSTELNVDQLETLASMLSVIADGDDPCALANYYQGQATAVLFMRRPKAEPSVDVLLSPHVFCQNMESVDDPHCTACGLPARNAVHFA